MLDATTTLELRAWRTTSMHDEMERLIRAKARRLNISVDTLKDVIADRVVATECEEDISSIILSLTHGDVAEFTRFHKQWS